ncbi:MAG: NAD(P)/FAD-dependent oxidoreductase [Pseudomonadota bacterium]
MDAVIIGAGPAGSTAAMRLAAAGWSVAVVEKSTFPRRKVCGECIAASNLPLLDTLGVGAEFDRLAGPGLRRMGLFVGTRRILAPLPPLVHPVHHWGRALGREHLDSMLLARARELGVQVWQPWSVKRQDRDGDGHVCTLSRAGGGDNVELRAPVVIDAHGSWEPAPRGDNPNDGTTRRPHRGSDLLAFKSTWHSAAIEPGLLPVLAFAGGYGGIVLGDHGLTTLAFCIRRDVLQVLRGQHPGASASQAALAHVQAECAGVAEVLVGAQLAGPWLAVGPLQPGIRDAWRGNGLFAIGNAAGEAHPILGEGMSMAIQSAWLLCDRLIAHRQRAGAMRFEALDWSAVGQDYTRAWRFAFASRVRMAATCAQLAMRPTTAGALLPLLQCWPGLLTLGARAAGKVRQAAVAPGTPPANQALLPLAPGVHR